MVVVRYGVLETVRMILGAIYLDIGDKLEWGAFEMLVILKEEAENETKGVNDHE